MAEAKKMKEKIQEETEKKAKREKEKGMVKVITTMFGLETKADGDGCAAFSPEASVAVQSKAKTAGRGHLRAKQASNFKRDKTRKKQRNGCKKTHK